MPGDDRRDETDVCGERGDTSGDEHGVEPAAHSVGPVVRTVEPVRLQAEGVLDRDEVEQAALGLLDQIGPVPGVEQFRGPRAAPARLPDASLPRPARGRGPAAGGGSSGAILHGGATGTPQMMGTD